MVWLSRLKTSWQSLVPFGHIMCQKAVEEPGNEASTFVIASFPGLPRVSSSVCIQYNTGKQKSDTGLVDYTWVYIPGDSEQ